MILQSGWNMSLRRWRWNGRDKDKKELERLKWLRKAAYMMPPCKTADETSIKVTNLTILGGEIAKLERQLYVCQHPEVDNI